MGYGPSVNQQTLMAMQEELAALRELLAAQGSSGGSTTSVGLPAGGQPPAWTTEHGTTAVGGVTEGAYSYTTPTAPPPMARILLVLYKHPVGANKPISCPRR